MTVPLSQEQLAAVISQAVQAGIQQALATALPPEDQSNTEKKKRTLDPKDFSRIDTFVGDEKMWKE